ncbi:putative ankyrin repeat protein RF_0381 [Artemia franciscana]|uniref:putative ankyrin repeat protein RF_0381 n=1 Tax=Artemia franciscana TaxID=6661 RepID=UPI0032DBA740
MSKREEPKIPLKNQCKEKWAAFKTIIIGCFQRNSDVKDNGTSKKSQSSPIGNKDTLNADQVENKSCWRKLNGFYKQMKKDNNPKTAEGEKEPDAPKEMKIENRGSTTEPNNLKNKERFAVAKDKLKSCQLLDKSEISPVGTEDTLNADKTKDEIYWTKFKIFFEQKKKTKDPDTVYIEKEFEANKEEKIEIRRKTMKYDYLKKEVKLNFESWESCRLIPLDHAAVESNLLEKGSNANFKTDNRDNHRKTSLYCVAAEAKIGICQLLVSKFVKTNLLDYKGYTPLHMAVKNGHTSLVCYLLEKGSNPNLRAEHWEDHGKTPLHFASEEGKPDICQLLVSKGANINLLDYNCYTPLHFAAEEGKLDICQLLVSKGAHINSTYSPLAPLHLAAKKGHMAVAEYLLTKGANPHLRASGWSNGGKTPLHFAAAEGKLDICQLLVSKGVHIDILDNNNFTPLHWTAKNGHISVAYYFSEKGADLNFKAENREGSGITPLHLAAAKGTLDICQFLVSKGAHIDAIDNKRLTPLHWAAKRGQISVANYLLEKGANLNLKADKMD